MPQGSYAFTLTSKNSYRASNYADFAATLILKTAYLRGPDKKILPFLRRFGWNRRLRNPMPYVQPAFYKMSVC